jgi:hypothetical protein
MRVFGLLLLSGLGVMAVANFADRFLSVVHELWTIAATGLGIGFAWLADFNLWKLWHLAVREDWIGVTLTGLILGGLAVFWRELVGFFASLSRKFTDEAVAIEKGQELRRVA